LFLIIHRFFREFCEQRPRLDRVMQSFPGTALRMALTFAAVCLAWVFFLTASLEAKTRMKQINDFFAAKEAKEKNSPQDSSAEADGRSSLIPTYSATQATWTILQRLVVPHYGPKPDGQQILKGSPLHNRSLWVTVGVVIWCHVFMYFGIWKKLSIHMPAP